MAENLKHYVDELRKNYYKKWREKNKEKIKEYNQKYWLKKAQKLVNSEA